MAAVRDSHSAPTTRVGGGSVIGSRPRDPDVAFPEEDDRPDQEERRSPAAGDARALAHGR